MQGTTIGLRCGSYPMVGGGTIEVVKTGGAGAAKITVTPNGGAMTVLLVNENGYVTVPQQEPPVKVSPVNVFVEPPVSATPDTEKPKVPPASEKGGWKR